MNDDTLREHLDEPREELTVRQQELFAARGEAVKLAEQLDELDRLRENEEQLRKHEQQVRKDAVEELATAREALEHPLAQGELLASNQRDVEVADARAREANRLLAAARRDNKNLKAERDQFRTRLQQQYDMTWTRLGTVVREARSPRGFVRAPARAVRILRSRGTSARAVRILRSRGTSAMQLVSATAAQSARRRAAALLGIDVDDVDVPSPLALLAEAADIAPVAEWPDTDAATTAARRMIGSNDAKLNDTLVGAALRREDTEWIAGLLTDNGVQPPLGPVARLALVEALRALGEIRRPLQLLVGADTSQPRVEEHRMALSRNQNILDHGVQLEAPAMIKSSADSVDSLYLLHNSLPYKSGGYATRTHGLLTGLDRLGRDVIGVTRPGFPPQKRSFDQLAGIPTDDVVDGIRYSRLIGPVTSAPRSDLQGFVDLYAKLAEPLVNEVRPRLMIHGASNWWNGHGAVALARSIDVPSIYEVRGLWEITRASREPGWIGSDVFALDAMYEAEAARLADRVICITGGLRDEMVARGIPAEKITIVPNAVDVDRFASAPDDDSVRRELGWENKCILGFVGSLTFYEGLDLLLHAVQQASNETATELAVLIVGDGPMLEPLKALAVELGLDDRCHFSGRVPHSEVERYLSAVDITPFPRLPLPVCEMVVAA